ncbi:glucosamine-6-phosphate isomerases/6-phosphogluconolactonase-domain-containing protein [Haematococcus lacustris]
MASGIVSPISTSKGAGVDVQAHQFQYPSVEGDANIVLHFSKAGVEQGIVKAVTEASEAAIKAKGSFTLVLSGGSLLNFLSGLADSKKISSWDKWHIYYVDERNVPHTSPDSNHKGACTAFLSKVPIPAANQHAILENVPVDQAAKHYEGMLIGTPTTILPRNSDGLPVFDLMLLGTGPDGHIASLFPNAPQTAATSGWVLPVSNSPKPPPERITFTLPVINAAKEIIFVASGEEKAEIVQRILEIQALPGALPAQLVRPSQGTLRWFLDVQSAQKLDISNWEDRKAFPRTT